MGSGKKKRHRQGGKKRGREKEKKYLLGSGWKNNENFQKGYHWFLDGKWLGAEGQ